jgi:hypothetical protein
MKKNKEMNDRLERQLEKVLDGYLEDYSFEEFLENFNVTPFELFLVGFNSGLIEAF